MSLLDIGAQCYACTLIDFLPFPCPTCSHTFCANHIHGHGCASPDRAPGPSVKRRRGVCARPACENETIESVGGLEVGLEGEGIAREVRCPGCAEAFCISHRAQDAHDCTAPRFYDARHDATIARREKAKQLLARNFPQQAAKERVTMPKQVDRTRSSKAEEPKSGPTTAANTDTTAQVVPPAATPGPEDKLFKAHLMTIRSLAKPLEPRFASASRDESVSVEWVVDESGSRVRQWVAGPEGKYNPKAAGLALAGPPAKPSRVWVPLSTPVGKLFDSLATQGKVARPKDSADAKQVCTQPGAPRTPVVLDLSQAVQSQISSGDVLVLVRGWGTE
ncbi:hypothetical protein VHUM_01527 [Vanrija humicola]|uniref:AN1-type domain-containing protein n=1 Tax=Vanrija humicola TaxID=5417 RepID=A0A7D8V3G8_VANHU|nr:hypothetical protein VHUM_01527 [Vanrija humicola]